MWLCLVSVRCIIIGFFLVFVTGCRYKIVLCIPLVLKVAAFMDGCRYSFVSDVSSFIFVFCIVFGAYVGFWVRVPWVRFQFF